MSDVLDEFMAANPRLCSGIEHNAKDNRQGYFNPRDPEVYLQSEKPEHRNILLLKMNGHTNLEIAELTGYTPVHIATVVKQPWAQEFMSKNQNSVGIKKVETMLNGAAGKAVERLIVEIDARDGTAMSRIAAAREILDRKFGKATQPVEHRRIGDANKMSDAEIEKRIEELQRVQATRS